MLTRRVIVIEICAKHPKGPTRVRGNDVRRAWQSTRAKSSKAARKIPASSDPFMPTRCQWVRSKIGPPGWHFIYISITTPIAPASKNYAGILNHFWIQVAVPILKPPHGIFRV